MTVISNHKHAPPLTLACFVDTVKTLYTSSLTGREGGEPEANKAPNPDAHKVNRRRRENVFPFRDVLMLMTFDGLMIHAHLDYNWNA
jgi:hypothetical protein